jgi:hypothetical protein
VSRLFKYFALAIAAALLLACGGGGGGGSNKSGGQNQNALPDRVVAFPLTN